LGTDPTLVCRTALIWRPSFSQHLTAERHAPPCPFCNPEDTIVVGHDGIHGAITLCRCNKCRGEWPETVADDPDLLKEN
jgi:hypothetical protein